MIIAVLMGIPADIAGKATTSIPHDLIWTCTGRYSGLTYLDSPGVYYDSSGCYFLEHFAQYRPCARICNDVVVGSTDEEKCRAYCTGDLHNLCLCKYI